MALNDNAVFVPAQGFIFVAPSGTASPSVATIEAFDPASPTVASYESIGYTARDELPSFGFDGGDTETRGAWENAALREVVTEVASDFVTFNCIQFDEQVLSLYYGESNPGSVVGKFDVNNVSTSPLQRALLIIIVDGDIRVALHATKTSIRREDAIELTVDEFGTVPLRATFLKDGSNPLFSWISTDTGVNLT